MSFTVARLIALIISDSYPTSFCATDQLLGICRAFCSSNDIPNRLVRAGRQDTADRTKGYNGQTAAPGHLATRSLTMCVHFASKCLCDSVCECAMCAPGCLLSGFASLTSYDLFRKQ